MPAIAMHIKNNNLQVVDNQLLVQV